MPVSLHKPTHRREITTGYNERGGADPRNEARCDIEGRYIGTACNRVSAYCPRHSPDAYAEHMARHADDSQVKISGFYRTEVDW